MGAPVRQRFYSRRLKQTGRPSRAYKHLLFVGVVERTGIVIGL